VGIYKPIYTRTLRALLIIACAVGFSFASTANSATWSECAGEGQTCYGTTNPIRHKMIRYGVVGKWAYKYNKAVSTRYGQACNNSSFGDPAPGIVKKCYISSASRPSRGTSEITALHSVFDDSPQEYLASTLNAGEQLMGINNNYRLKMQSDGNLVLYTASGSSVWAIGIDPYNRAGDVYTFHVLPKGIEVRKNDQYVIWSAYPNNVSQTTNYILTVSAAGNVYLQDMELNKVRWRVGPNQSPQFRSDNIAENIVEDVWERAGWGHASDWSASDHSTFRRLHSDHSHWSWHNFIQTLNNVKSDVAGVEQAAWDSLGDIAKAESGLGKDAWDEYQDIYSALSNAESEILADNMDKILDLATELGSDSVIFAQGLASLITDLENEALDIAELMEEQVERVADGGVLSSEHSEMITALEAFNQEQGRSLSAATTEAVCNTRLCEFLSKEENNNKRVDYALEIAPTAVAKMFEGFFDAGLVSQVQFRVFFTHPRVNGEGRYSTEIRLRVFNYTGIYGDASFSNDYATGAVAVDAGALSVHDIILPYTWGKGERFRDRKFEGVKYLSLTGVLAEADLAFSKVDFNKIAKFVAGAQRVSNAARAVIGGNIEMTDVSNTDVINQVFGDQAPAGIETRINDSYKNLPTKFRASVDVEAGIGIGAAFVYDLREMRDLRQSRGYNSTVTGLMVKIILVEMLGEAAAIGLGMLSGANEAAALADLLAPALNVEFMAGGLVGDFVYTGFHRYIYGRTDGIWMGASSFFWAAAKTQLWSFAADGFSQKATQLFGTTGHTTGAPIKIRAQFNITLREKEWFSGGNPRLKNHGSLELLTRHNKCLYRDPASGFGSSYVSQRSCVNNDSKYRWKAKSIGNPSDNIYQIRSESNGGSCITIDSSAYDDGNPSVANGTTVNVQSCSTSSNNDPRADRWIVRRLAGKMMFKSVVDPSKCLDLSGGSSAEGRKIHMWSCNHANQNQLFTPRYKNGVIASNSWNNLVGQGGSYTIRTSSGMCIGNQARANVPSRGTKFVLQNCDENLSFSNSSQTYYLVDIGSGYYKIMLSHTDPRSIQSNRRYLDVSGVSQANGAAVHAWTGTSGDNQEWKAIVMDDGGVKLQARHSGKCLQYNDKNLVQQTCRTRHDANQKFVINGIGYASSGGYDSNPDLGN
jgi:hypothetical protein